VTRAEALTGGYKRLVTAGIPTAEARLESNLLLRHATNLSREELFLRPDVPLTDSEHERFNTIIARRAAREPLAYITGTRDFYGLTFAVTPDVLIPRPETEGVVEAVLALVPEALTPGPSPSEGRGGGGSQTLPCASSDFPLPPKGEGPGVRAPKILDLCTGSGCIAVAVAVHAPYARISATDISTNALVVAESNANRHGVTDRVSFIPGDLFAPVPPGARFAVIASNPPYIAPDAIEHLEPEVRDYEPRIALGVDPDDLYFYRRIASESPPPSRRWGGVVVEVGQGQAEAVRELFRDAGFTDVSVLPDLAGIPRVVVAKEHREP
jgi:release factor glutamine methyltransferase